MRTGPKPRPAFDRLMERVVITNDGCWVSGHAKNNGYAMITDADGRMVRAHRLAYEHLVGPIDDGLQLDHLCRVRPCVNPSHLEQVTTAENLRRGALARACVGSPPTKGKEQ